MNDKKVIRAWCAYDIANSAYSLIITTVLFPIYYTSVTETAFGGSQIHFLGFTAKNSVVYDYVISAAYLTIVFLSPILSGIADYTRTKKRFMQGFTYLGSISCFGLYWFTGRNTEYGLILAGMAVIGYSGSLVFYNSFLPLIASPDRQDSVSAQGFSWGYAGSVILLIINIITIKTYSLWGFSSELDALRFSFLEVGIWWASVSLFTFYYLKDTSEKGLSTEHFIVRGFKELSKVAKSVAKMKNSKLFLLSFFFNSIGVQTIILVAAIFGTVVLSIPSQRMIFVIILLQLVAMGGAHLFAKVSQLRGNKFSLITMLFIWIAVCIGAFYINMEYQFYILASCVGLVLGGIQSQSRSTFSKLIPEDTVDTASYFSFYDITEKLAIVVGMFLFGFIEQVTGSMRVSALTFSMFFITGLVLMSFTKLRKS